MLSAVAADSQVNFSNSVVAQESGEGECENTGRARTRFSPAEEFLLDLRNLTHSWHADEPGLTTSSVYTDNTITFLDFSPSLHDMLIEVWRPSFLALSEARVAQLSHSTAVPSSPNNSANRALQPDLPAFQWAARHDWPTPEARVALPNRPLRPVPERS